MAASIAALALVAPALAGAETSRRRDVLAPNPDAELIRLCAEFDARERERHGLDGSGAVGSPEEAAYEAAWDRINAAQEVILAAIKRHPPATLAGVAALSRSIMFEEAALHAAGPHTFGGRLAWHLVESLAEVRA